MEKPIDCCFCGRNGDETRVLVAGPQVLICDACVINATARMIQSASATAPVDGVEHCSFCGKAQKSVLCMARYESRAICNECVVLTTEIVLERIGKGRAVKLPPWNAPVADA